MRLVKFLFIILLIILNVYTFTHKRYENISEGGSPNIFALIKWNLTREKSQWPDLPKSFIGHNHQLPDKVNIGEILITYINHSTFLIQIDGLNILTDPVWSEYAGPYGKFGVRRSIYPGLSMEKLPRIDFILISHSHYDHLDLPSIEALTKANNSRIIAGLGVVEAIDYCKVNNDHCIALNWWDEVKVSDTKISFSFVPAHHWSGRFLFDKNTSLWGGFVIQSDKDNIYFAGDTGFGDGKIFQMIKEKFSNFTVSLLPIGAYKPEWFFRNMHTSPEDAVKILNILGSKYAIPIHYDTFQLTDEAYQDPLKDLEAAMQKYKVVKDSFPIMKPGQSIKFSKDIKTYLLLD